MKKVKVICCRVTFNFIKESQIMPAKQGDIRL